MSDHFYGKHFCICNDCIKAFKSGGEKTLRLETLEESGRFDKYNEAKQGLLHCEWCGKAYTMGALFDGMFVKAPESTQGGNTMELTERDIIDGLRALLWGEELENTQLEDSDTRTFEEGGYLTWDEGFTLDVGGHRFQITVRQER